MSRLPSLGIRSIDDYDPNESPRRCARIRQLFWGAQVRTCLFQQEFSVISNSLFVTDDSHTNLRESISSESFCFVFVFIAHRQCATFSRFIVSQKERFLAEQQRDILRGMMEQLQRTNCDEEIKASPNLKYVKAREAEKKKRMKEQQMEFEDAVLAYYNKLLHEMRVFSVVVSVKF